jgi:EVE domain-containing protein
MPVPITRASLGAWLIKCNPSVTDVGAIVEAGGGTITSWCVARNYRAAMMQPGDPVVFWVSGSDHGCLVPGVWGLGEVTGEVEDGTRPSVPMRVRLLADPLPRAELRAAAEFADLEVLSQPMGSNPSWLNIRQWQALRALLTARSDD